MRLYSGVGEDVGLRHPGGETGSMPRAVLATARRRARWAILALWVSFAASLFVLPEEAILALAVLLAGITTVLESMHGALAFDRLLQRLVTPAF
jgi:hypothetical protein